MRKSYIFAVSALLISFNAAASDYFSLVDVRYTNGLKKTFLTGNIKNKKICEMIGNNIWDGVVAVCDGCKKEIQFCSEMENISPIFLTALKGDAIPFPYVFATEKGRIILTGATPATLHQECDDSADNFKNSGYPISHCVKATGFQIAKKNASDHRQNPPKK